MNSATRLFGAPIASAMLLLASTTAIAAVDSVPSNPNGGFPFRTAVIALANDLYPQYTSVFENEATLQSLAPERKVVDLRATGDTALAPEVRHALIRKSFFVKDTGYWAHVADLDTTITTTSSTVDLTMDVRWLAGGIGLATLYPDLQGIAGWGFHKSWHAHSTEDLLEVAAAITNPNDVPNVAAAISGSVDLFAAVTSVTSANGKTISSNNANVDWATQVSQLAASGPATPQPKQDLVDCLQDCAGELEIVLGYVELLCLGIGGAACLAGGPAGFPPCFALVWSGCGMVGGIGTAVNLVACLIKCAF